ncbi:MAG: transketolase [Bdellovibrionota bacterium]
MTVSYTKEQLTLVANTIRMLSADGVEKANSGHPGMPMGMADLAAVLWLKYLRFNPEQPKWLARDRFVLSNGHGSMLLYSLLHLAGFKLSIDDLKQFRQWESKTPGHPESYMTEGVECTTGPLGQGISNAVGMAIGQKLMASRYDADLFAHRVFVFAGDGCLMEGVSSEASSVAGHLGLGNMIVIYDDNHISIAGHTELAFTEDVCKRYEAYGWNTMRIDGHDYDQIDKALAAAVAVTDRPTLIAARTTIGWGSPNKKDTHGVHGSPLGKDEMAATKKALNWPQEPTFYVPDETKKAFAGRIESLKQEYSSWVQKFEGWKKAKPDLAKGLDAQVKREVPADLADKLIAALPTDGKPVATRKLSQSVLQALSANVNSVIGGSADLEPSTLTLIAGSGDVEKGTFSGKNLRFGVREHGMGAIMNGLAYYGGYIPYGSTFLCFYDYMRPTIRLAALSHLPGLFIFTHDSIFLGEDGPTHQPIEHVNSARMVPNVHVFRPADGLEVAMCYKLAVELKTGPALFSLTRQNLPQLERPQAFKKEDIEKGAYVLYESKPGTAPQICFVATGSEVGLALEAAKTLAEKAAVRVVSMPCCELFRKQSKQFRDQLVPPASKKVVCEAGTSFGWASILEADISSLECCCIDHFGASAPDTVLAEKFGFTAKSVVERVTKRFLS